VPVSGVCEKLASLAETYYRGKGPDFTCGTSATTVGRLNKRISSRGATATYGDNYARDLSGITCRNFISPPHPEK